MLNFNKRFYIYVHVVNKQFTIGCVEYNIGDIVYVGSGQRSRYRVKDSSRSKEHLLYWDYLDKIIIEDNLTESEKFKKEADKIKEYSLTSRLFNKRSQHNSTFEIPYNIFSYFFKVDTNSESCLSWQNGFNKDSSINSKSGNYYQVWFAGKSFQVSRILWSLYHKTDCPCDKIVDHINGDSLDNSINNLRLTTYSENVANRVDYNSDKLIGVKLKVISGIKYVVLNLSRNSQCIRIVINVRKTFPCFSPEFAETTAISTAVELRKMLLTLMESGSVVTKIIQKELLDSIITNKLLTLEKEIK